MNPFLVSALIGGGGLAKDVGGYLGQREVNQTNAANAAAQRKFDLKMWKLNNEYNSPVKQMERYKEAGLNPNLIYGSGSSSSGLSSSYPRYTMPNVVNEFGNLGSGTLQALSMAMDLRLKSAQVNAINNNAEFTQQRTLNEAIKGGLMTAQKGYLGVQSDYSLTKANQIKALLPYQTSAIEESINKLRLGNKDMMFKLEKLNPETFKKLTLENALKTQTLNDLNPALLKLRNIEYSMKKLGFDFESQLNKFGQTSRDSAMTRALIKLFDNPNSPKFSKSRTGFAGGDIGLNLLDYFIMQ